MTDKYDAIVIGAGHNGLICSALLAKAGKKVLVLEANDQVGGAAITREFTDGFSVSACAHLLYQMQPQVKKDLDLEIDVTATDLITIVLSEKGKHIKNCGNDVSGGSDSDGDNYRKFYNKKVLMSTRINDTSYRYVHQ